MARGHFIVSPAARQGEITFQPDPTADGEPPDDQVSLVNDVEGACRVLRAVFKDRDADFERYCAAVLSLAQGGVVGNLARPPMARLALVGIKREVLEREAGRVKNQYMGKLGAAAAWFAVPGVGLGCVARMAATYPRFQSPHGILSADVFSNFCLLVAGCAVGVWLSFGARKAILTFEDLSIPEADFLRPSTRLVFAELLTLAFALLFQAGAIEVTFGALSTAQIFTRPVAALLIGILCGFSEQVLSGALATHARRLFEPIAR